MDAPDSAAGAAAKSVRLVRVGQGAGAGRGGAGGPGHWRGYASSGNNRQKRYGALVHACGSGNGPH